jgi:putative membrane protein
MKFKEDIRIFFVGMAMGVANIIPGVSGGTIAVVFGIYEDLMEALGKFVSDKVKRWQHVRFLIVLFAGSLIAVVALAGVLSWCFENYPLMTVYFFMGLILGSIPVVIKSHNDMKINTSRITALLVGIGVVIWLALLQGGAEGQGAKISVFAGYSPADYGYFLICGVVAASAMIIPGVSGSFILILLGVYWTVLGALSGFFKLLLNDGFSDEVSTRFLILSSLGIGVVAGILGFSRVMSWALKKYPAVTMYVILGLIIGSFYQIYPGFEFNLNGLGAIFTLAVGLIVSLKFAKYD